MPTFVSLMEHPTQGRMNVPEGKFQAYKEAGFVEVSRTVVPTEAEAKAAKKKAEAEAKAAEKKDESVETLPSESNPEESTVAAETPSEGAPAGADKKQK